MKRFYILVLGLSLVFIFNLQAQTNHIVKVSNFVFTPANLTIAIGDTVTWQWVQGTHTTTSDSTQGSDSWDAPIDASHTTFSFVIKFPGVHKYYCKFHGGPNGSGMSGTITVNSPTFVADNSVSPSSYLLEQNFPNPFNPTTEIKYYLPHKSFVTLKIFNVLGRPVSTLVNEEEPSGIYKVRFNASELNSGVYFYQLKANEFSDVKKMIVLK